MRFGEALLSKPVTLEMPATGVQPKKDISTLRRSFIMNLISLKSQLTKDSLRLGITCKSSRRKQLWIFQTGGSPVCLSASTRLLNEIQAQKRSGLSQNRSSMNQRCFLSQSPVQTKSTVSIMGWLSLLIMKMFWNREFLSKNGSLLGWKTFFLNLFMNYFQWVVLWKRFSLGKSMKKNCLNQRIILISFMMKGFRNWHCLILFLTVSQFCLILKLETQLLEIILLA